MQDFLLYIFFLFLITIFTGCIYLTFSDDINDYFKMHIMQSSWRNKIPYIDDSDIKLIKHIIPKIDIKTKPTKSPDLDSKIDLDLDLNGSIDNKSKGDSNDPSNSLPWDREIGSCEVLKGIDKDLYKTVQNTKTLIFY